MKISIKAKLPKSGRLFNTGNITAALQEGLLASAIKVSDDLDSSVETFENPPNVRLAPGEYAQNFKVYIEDEDYTRISEGTSTHNIEAAPGKMLAFPEESTPKTKPGRLKAQAGSKSAKLIFRKKVRVAGIKPRLFDVLVAKKNQNTVAKFVQKELNKTLKK